MYMYIYIYIYTYVYTNKTINQHLSLYTYTYMCLYAYIYIYIYVCNHPFVPPTSLIESSGRVRRAGLRCLRCAAGSERLAEYGWKPHRVVLGSNTSYWYMCEKQRGTVSSNWLFQTVLFQQYSANLAGSRLSKRGSGPRRPRLDILYQIISDDIIILQYTI